MFENWDVASYLVGLGVGILIGYVNGRASGWRKGFDAARRIYRDHIYD